MDNLGLIKAIYKIQKEIEDNEEFLSSLDNKIGDGDHGYNMKRGFDFAIKEIEDKKPNSIHQTLVLIGKTLISKVGGASGPLYGMAFTKGSQNLKNAIKLDYENLAIFLKDASVGIQLIGKAALGDKTMIDIWVPLAKDLKNKVDKKTLIDNLKKYKDNTRNLLALKGRASFLKERSIGTLDPGAVSSEIILKNLIEAL